MGWPLAWLSTTLVRAAAGALMGWAGPQPGWQHGPATTAAGSLVQDSGEGGSEVQPYCCGQIGVWKLTAWNRSQLWMGSRAAQGLLPGSGWGTALEGQARVAFWLLGGQGTTLGWLLDPLQSFMGWNTNSGVASVYTAWVRQFEICGSSEEHWGGTNC